MTYLLDTSTFLWAAAEPARLSRAARRICESEGAALTLSVVSFWEIIIKCGCGGLRIPDPERTLPDWAARLGARVLPVEAPHVLAVHALPPVHRDPFDRLLIAQAKVEDLPIITSDDSMRRYPVRCIW